MAMLDAGAPATKADLEVLEANLRREVQARVTDLGTQLTNRMLTIAGLGVAAGAALIAAFR